LGRAERVCSNFVTGGNVITVKGFWRHIATGDIYAVESTSFGQVMGGVGPMAANELIKLETYEYKQDVKEFLQEAIDKGRMRKFEPAYTPE
jgi:hypothetical protein